MTIHIYYVRFPLIDVSRFVLDWTAGHFPKTRLGEAFVCEFIEQSWWEDEFIGPYIMILYHEPETARALQMIYQDFTDSEDSGINPATKRYRRKRLS